MTEQRKRVRRPKVELDPVVGLVGTVDAGDRLAALRALRHRLAEAIEHPATHPRDLAALARQLASVMREVEQLEQARPLEVDSVDELERKRAARRAGTEDPGASAGKVRGGAGSGRARKSGGADVGPVAGAGSRSGAR